MKNIIYTTILFYCFTFSFILSQESSTDIQNNISKKNKELNDLSDEIKNLAQQITSKENETKVGMNKLLEIEKKINLTYDIIALIKKQRTELTTTIIKLEEKIKQNEKELKILKGKYINIVTYLYKNKRNSYLDIILSSKNWDQITYSYKYLEILTNEKKKIDLSIQNIIDTLDKEMLLLKNKILEKEKENLANKSSIIELKSNKKNEQKNIDKTNIEKFDLEKERLKKKKEYEKINILIKELLADKEAALEREKKLREIRLQREREKEKEKKLYKTEQFVNLKGKLPWPVMGDIVGSYGVINSLDGIKTSNPGIDIKTKTNSEVYSIFDGIVAEIGYTPIYGSYIIIDHGDKYSTFYGNVNENNILVSKSDYVEYSQTIATTLSPENEEFGILNFMIFETAQGNNGIPIITNKNPEEWIK